mmetsp:Transcript_52573/g.63378  ORF Transcript_52573/g.63378 Transcript_52573/m.63378 type:complete len:212 (-) Transcript_52573:423-1058(-)
MVVTFSSDSTVRSSISFCASLFISSILFLSASISSIDAIASVLDLLKSSFNSAIEESDNARKASSSACLHRTSPSSSEIFLSILVCSATSISILAFAAPISTEYPEMRFKESSLDSFISDSRLHTFFRHSSNDVVNILFLSSDPSTFTWAASSSSSKVRTFASCDSKTTSFSSNRTVKLNSFSSDANLCSSISFSAKSSFALLLSFSNAAD